MKKAKSYFKHVKINGIKSFWKIYESNLDSKEQWIYRGQSDSKWDLETSFERNLKRFGGNGSKIHNRTYEEVESGIIRYFQRKVKNYQGLNFPDKFDYPGWLSIIQHYGGPTRFFDWTFSFPVACFFAIEESTTDSSIWSIRFNWLLERIKSVFNSNEDWENMHEKQLLQKPEVFNKCFRAQPRKFVYPLNPYSLNERLSIQQGIFLCQGNINCSFENNLLNLISNLKEKDILDSCKIYTVKNSLKLRESIFNILIRNNISRASLFPGIEGLTGSLSALLSKPEILFPEPEYKSFIMSKKGIK